MGWLIELLLEAIKEKCSQFIVDMMELITSMFTELLSCDLNLFEELFGVVGDLYRNVIIPLAIALLLLILVWQLFKSMFGRMGMNSEDPVELVCRSGACLFMIVGAKAAINYILGIAGTPYQWVVGTSIEVESFSEYVSLLEGVTAVLGIDSISVMILMLIMQFVVAWNYFKMLFIIAERYVLLGVFSYTAPLAFATGGSKATNSILSSWVKMFGGQIILIIMNAWCMKMFLSGYGNMLASGYGFTKFFVATLCLVGFCKVTFKLDSYMASLGVNLGRPTNGLGAMGLLMAASRLFGRGSHSGSFGGATGGTDGSSAGAAAGTAASAAAGMAAQGMAQSMGTPIPMGAELLGGAGDGDLAAEAEEVSQDGGFEDDMEAQAESMDELENDSILDALGEMPEDGAAEEMAFEDGAGEGVPLAGEDKDGVMELDGDEQLNGMPESEGAEMFHEDGSIDGLGDYPVNREEEQEEETVEEAMELEGTIPTEEGGMEEATCGSAGSGFGESTGLASGGQGRSAGNTDAGGNILEELGSSVESAPSEVQQDSGSGAEQEFFEATSGGISPKTEDAHSGEDVPDAAYEGSTFQTESGTDAGLFGSGEADAFRPQEEAWELNSGIRTEDAYSNVENANFRSSQGNKNGQPGNPYGEIPDVPQSREALEEWKRKQGNSQDGLP